MTTFLDGPAMGQSLGLSRAPLFLRVTEDGGKWDALDQLDDEAKPLEKIHIYIRRSYDGMMHIDRRKPHGSTWHVMATYELFPGTVNDEHVRTIGAWRKFCVHHQRGVLAHLADSK